MGSTNQRGRSDLVVFWYPSPKSVIQTLVLPTLPFTSLIWNSNQSALKHKGEYVTAVPLKSL